MQTRILLSALGLLCVAGLALKVHANYPTQGRTVKLSVAATDASPGSTLHYQWRSTDGTLISVDAPSATWTLPAGPGLHFAYVLVSNGLGGYTEKRIAVNTDTFGSYIPSTTPRAYVAPPASAPTGDTYRSWVDWNQTYVDGFNHDVQVPDASVYLVDNNTGTTYPPSGSVKTDLRGQYVIPNVPPGNSYDAFCELPGTSSFTQCTGGFFFFNGMPMPNVATTDYLGSYPSTDNNHGAMSGNLILQDGSTCGTVNEFFGVHSTGTATLLDASGNVLSGPVRLNEQGDYSLLWDFTAATPASVSLSCEGAPPLSVAVTPDALNLWDVGTATLTNISAPQVQKMTATLNGTVIASADFTVAPQPLPSDVVKRADDFLAEKGLDTRMGACQYYKVIGAANDCDTNGNMVSRSLSQTGNEPSKSARMRRTTFRRIRPRTSTKLI